jgi:MYXO-CTERM domain-containing protein
MRTGRIFGTLVFTFGLASGAAWAERAHPTDQNVDEGVRGHEIINGTAANGGVYEAVVALTDSQKSWFCSGTYIGQRRVASAAHCLAGGPPPKFVYFGAAADSDAAACQQGNQTACAKFVGVQSATANPLYASSGGQDGDISVIVLKADPPAGVPAVPIVNAGDGTELTEADNGQPCDFAGFGVENGVNQSGGGTRLHVTITFGNLGPGSAPDGTYDADSFYYAQPSGGPCNGDSGGPAFLTRGGQLYLAGVTSWGDQNCTQYGVSTRVDTYADFLLPGTPGLADAGPGAPDAAAGTPDAAGNGPDAATPDAGGTGGDDSGGCGCRAGGETHGQAALAGLALVGAAIVVARRRAAR